MANPYRVALVTAPAGRISEALARGLVERKLAACVNIVAGVVSHYRWEGKVCRDRESLLVIKTRAALWPKLRRFIEANHPARVPEIIGLSITQGSRDYLAWLRASTRP